MKTYKGIITTLPNNGVFVFGSNTQGRHGKGSALIAKQKFGAIYGQAKGLQGNSYGIVTKDLTVKVHPSITKYEISNQIRELYEFANVNKHLEFYIAYKATGTNLNAYSSEDMAKLFAIYKIPSNIVFEEDFYKLITT